VGKGVKFLEWNEYYSRDFRNNIMKRYNRNGMWKKSREKRDSTKSGKGSFLEEREGNFLGRKGS